MKDVWIERLVTRGEQIVLAQDEQHWSSIQQAQQTQQVKPQINQETGKL